MPITVIALTHISHNTTYAGVQWDRSRGGAARGVCDTPGQEIEHGAMKRIAHTAATEQPGTIEERLLAVFEAEGLRNTRPRRVIVEQLAALAASGADFTAHDLWRDLQAKDPGLGRATVYRAVDLLLSKGMLDRVPFADGTHRYRLCGGAHHHHLTCTQCQRVVEISACLPPDLLAAISATTDFAIDGHSVELFGRCSTCRDDDPAQS